MQPRNPPIVELVISAQFATERPVDTTKLVLFWNEYLRAEYPVASEAPAIEDTFEKFGDNVRWQQPSIRLNLETTPQLRFQFTSSARDRMVQLQPTRLILNWVRKEEAYPRFSTLREEFSRRFTSWQTFAAGQDIGEVVPNQWELCYVNFIPRGELWKTPDEWHRVSSLFVDSVSDFEPLVLEDRTFQWRMRLPDARGRITLSVGQVKNSDGQLGMQLVILARGPASTDAEVVDRLQTAHDEIIKLFDRLATTEAKEHWGMHHHG